MSKSMNQISLEREASEGDSPVDEVDMMLLEEQRAPDWTREYRGINL